MSDWQPIETAPRDGTAIIGFGLWAGEISGPDDLPERAIISYDGRRGDYPGFDWIVHGTDQYAAWLKPVVWTPLPFAPSA